MRSTKTEAEYERCLGYISSANIDYKKIDNTMDYINKIEGMTTKSGTQISEATKKLYLSATVWYMTKTNQDVKKIEEIKTKITEIRNKLNKEVSTHKLIRNQKENYIKWEDVLDVYNGLKPKHKNSNTAYKTYVLLSCYVLMAPRRLKDFALMDVIESETDDINKERNYYVKEGGYFIFNNYKTSKTYNSKRIKPIEDHKLILDEYIKYYNIEGSLLGLTENAIKGKLLRLFKKEKNKSVSVNILRHSYISWLRDNGKLKENNNIWLIMGHSKGMQNAYYKMEQELEEADMDDYDEIDDDQNDELIIMENVYD